MTIWHFGTSHSLGAGIFAEDKKHLHGDGDNSMRRYEQTYITPFLVQQLTNKHVHNFAIAGIENHQIIWTFEKALLGLAKYPDDPMRPRWAVFEMRSHPDHGTIPVTDDMINTKFHRYYTALTKLAKIEVTSKRPKYDRDVNSEQYNHYGPRTELEEYLISHHTLAGTYHHATGIEPFLDHTVDNPKGVTKNFGARGGALLHDGLFFNIRNTLRNYANAMTDRERLEMQLGGERAKEIDESLKGTNLAKLVLRQLPGIVGPYLELDHPIWEFDMLAAISRSKAAFPDWNNPDTRGRINMGHASSLFDRWTLSMEVQAIRGMCSKFDIEPIFYWQDNNALYVTDQKYDPVNSHDDMLLKGNGMSLEYSNKYGSEARYEAFSYCVCGHWSPEMHRFIAEHLAEKILSEDK